MKAVGYHGWSDDHTVALFIGGEEPHPHTMLIANTQTRETKKILDNPGRAFYKVPGENAMSFVQKVSENATLYQFNPATDKEWQEVANLENAGIVKISRLAVSQDGKNCALVTNRKA